MTRDEWNTVAIETGDDVLFQAIEDWGEETERLEGKIKFLEAWKDAEGKAYGRLLETSLRALET